MYRYLTTLGASPVLVGLTVTVGAPFEMILTLLASFLVPLIGHVTIIIFGLFAHSIRLLGELLESDDIVRKGEIIKEEEEEKVTGREGAVVEKKIKRKNEKEVELVLF